MNLIERLGGYEEAKIRLNGGDPKLSYYSELAAELLEYRRQNGIYEEGDKVVFVDDFMHGELMTVAWTRKGEVWMDDGAKRCTDLSMIKHATEEEIKSNKRIG